MGGIRLRYFNNNTLARWRFSFRCDGLDVYFINTRTNPGFAALVDTFNIRFRSFNQVKFVAGIEVISPVAGKSPGAKDAAEAESTTANGPDIPAGGDAPVPPEEAKTRKERLQQRRTEQQTEAWQKE